MKTGSLEAFLDAEIDRLQPFAGEYRTANRHMLSALLIFKERWEQARPKEAVLETTIDQRAADMAVAIRGGYVPDGRDHPAGLEKYFAKQLAAVEREALERAAKVAEVHAETTARQAHAALNRPGGGWDTSENNQMLRLEGEAEAAAYLADALRKLVVSGDTLPAAPTCRHQSYSVPIDGKGPGKCMACGAPVER